VITGRKGLISSVLFAFLLAAPLAAGPKEKEEVENCLSCHGDKNASFKLPDGSVQSVYVDKAVFEKSVHGTKITCTGCHPAQGELPHPDVKAKTKAEFAASFKDLCKSCHFENYTKALDGVHFAVIQKGGAAPFCTDCHGSHDVAKPESPKTRVSDTCGTCHSDVADVFGKSVHGLALAKGSQDVPVCVDCHKAHDTADPKTTSWRLKTVDACAKCHTDKALMKKYGLSTDVVQTYLNDFHGMSASLASSGQSPRVITALCVDCHGMHDITKAKDGTSQVLQANLQKTCAKCHPGAPKNFTDAWLSHYQPSPKRAPLVWAVGIFYKVFIPFLIGGLVLQILLHLWRVMVNR
jgi:predicted CXXCH cytochrome family protein